MFRCVKTYPLLNAIFPCFVSLLVSLDNHISFGGNPDYASRLEEIDGGAEKKGSLDKQGGGHVLRLDVSFFLTRKTVKAPGSQDLTTYLNIYCM